MVKYCLNKHQLRTTILPKKVYDLLKIFPFMLFQKNACRSHLLPHEKDE